MCLRLVFLLITRLAGWLRLARREETWKTAEILILRHQLAVLQRRQPRRPKLNWADRALLAALLGVIPKACACRKSRPWLWPAELLFLPSGRDDHRSCACGSCSPRGVVVPDGGERPSISSPSQRRGEAGGSLIRGSPGRAGAASTKPGRFSTAGWAGPGERDGKVYERNRCCYAS